MRMSGFVATAIAVAAAACSPNYGALKGHASQTSDAAAPRDAGMLVPDVPVAQDMRLTDLAPESRPPDSTLDSTPDRPDPCLGKVDGTPCGSTTCDDLGGTTARAITTSVCRGGICTESFVFCSGQCVSYSVGPDGYTAYRVASCTPVISGATVSCRYDGGVPDGGMKTCGRVGNAFCVLKALPNCPAKAPGCMAVGCNP